MEGKDAVPHSWHLTRYDDVDSGFLLGVSSVAIWCRASDCGDWCLVMVVYSLRRRLESNHFSCFYSVCPNFLLGFLGLQGSGNMWPKLGFVWMAHPCPMCFLGLGPSFSFLD